MRGMFAIVLGLLAAAAPGLAAAEDAASYPSRPISLVVAYPAGGPPDLVARVIAPAIGEALGQTVVVQNKPGAGGIVGFSDVARSPKDGYTLVLADLSIAIDPLVYANPGYDPRKDFAWIGPVTRSYMTMLVDKDFPAKTVKDFIALAKQKPGELRVGTSGVGSPPWLGAVAFQNAAGIKLQEVPYRGIALAIADVIAQRISVAWMSLGPAKGQVAAGQLRVLGVFGPKRLANLPNVPTFQEAGIQSGAPDKGNWLGVAAPAGTPPAIIAKINAAVNKAVHDPAVRKRLEAADYEDLDGGTPEDFKKVVDESISFWGDLFHKLGVKPQ